MSSHCVPCGKRMFMLRGYFRIMKCKYDAPDCIIEICDKYYYIEKIPYHKDCIIKFYPLNKNNDLCSRLIETKVTNIKNGMWCIDLECGLPGIVHMLMHSKRGKHGYARYRYKLNIPYSDICDRDYMTHGGEYVYRAIMKEIKYLISDIDDEYLICLDKNYKQIIFKISKDRGNIHEKIMKEFNYAIAERKNIYAVILEGPMRNDFGIQIIQIVYDVKIEDEIQ